jgi:hypothetical protein
VAQHCARPTTLYVVAQPNFPKDCFCVGIFFNDRRLEREVGRVHWAPIIACENGGRKKQTRTEQEQGE